jgi:hypothetical protein
VKYDLDKIERAACKLGLKVERRGPGQGVCVRDSEGAIVVVFYSRAAEMSARFRPEEMRACLDIYDKIVAEAKNLLPDGWRKCEGRLFDFYRQHPSPATMLPHIRIPKGKVKKQDLLDMKQIIEQLLEQGE